jgi:Protein of unknown function (DUF1549)/Protein of unknown function (DUF1553)
MHVNCLKVAFLSLGQWLVLSCSMLLAATSVSDNASEPAAAPSGHLEMARRIDALLEQQWLGTKIEPAPPASDGEFLRRAYLDLTGVIPRASEVREFLADDRSDKRERLIDRLLASPRHATHLATTWRNRILPLGVEPERGREAVGLQKWLRTRFAKNLRYDNLVGELLLAIGGDELGPALYFQANDLAPEKMAASAAELFLGVKLECAQCHDHPFAEWSQRDFWGLAAFFARVKAPADRNMMMMSSYRLIDADRGEVTLPESSEVVAPKFPGGEAAAEEARRSRRVQLAIWMTSRDNPFFARAAVNWGWSHMFGRGLVDSLDDIDGENRTGNAQLLDELATYFVWSRYDLQQLWRTLANTRAYQLSSRTSDEEPRDPALFAQMLAKPLTPEQLYDSFVLLAPRVGIEQQGDVGAGGAPGGLDEDPVRVEFVRRMRPPPGGVTEYRAGTLQALMLMNGRVAAEVTGHDQSSLVGALDAPFMQEADQVEAVFLAVLARPPDAEEQHGCVEELKNAASGEARRRALSDILWALLNSTEFAFNH